MVVKIEFSDDDGLGERMYSIRHGAWSDSMRKV